MRLGWKQLKQMRRNRQVRISRSPIMVRTCRPTSVCTFPSRVGLAYLALDGSDGQLGGIDHTDVALEGLQQDETARQDFEG